MKSSVIVLGAGGHAKVCIELLRAMGEEVAFCIGNPDSPDKCVGVPVLKGDENLTRLKGEGFSRIFVAIGANKVRARLADQALELGYQLVNAVDPRAIVSPTAKLGVGIAVMAGAVINAETEVQDLAIINTGATVDHDCRIGRAAHIGPQSALAGNVKVGAFSFLGVGSKVIPEIKIGDGVMVGAGGVVIRDLPSSVKAVGVPVKVIGD